MEQLGLYIHIPFCIQKCRYCDFPSYAGLEDRYLPYVEALCKEIETKGKLAKEYTVKSIFLGGGTPTVLDANSLDLILQTIKTSFYIEETAEITIEANPATIDAKKLKSLRNSGYNRLSMGMQAWQNRLLQRLGRIHRIEDFVEDFKQARRAGFQNINADLMFALPEQSFVDWKETVEEVIALVPEHISAYSLIIEEGTPFYGEYEAGTLEPMEEELDRQMYEFVVTRLAEAGYHQYEISNFAKMGKESIHNRIYWERTPYLGMGLGAHSCFGGKRFHQTYDMETYLQAEDFLTIEEDAEEIDTKEAMSEFMFLGLRLTEGIAYERFQEYFGVTLNSVYEVEIQKLVEEGLLIQDVVGIRLTQRGTDLSNLVFERFV
ncbi:radical SAM family heme chaperone HemW [Chakrabartyella piscis]|uniref:radical SAM family heme chaperone HemW n=1 Tax=Chakrabartyella piscis TaxID=2918914 RepID=UPI0029584895|nr:radical SAM family heme chaperone HemW [Chakrabartyella piscis]